MGKNIECKTKILFLTGSFGVGGKERQLAEIIRYLNKNNYEIYTFSKKLNENYLSNYDISLHLSGYKILNRNKFNLTDMFCLYKYVKEIKPDIVFSFSSTLAHFLFLSKIMNNWNMKIINGSIRSAQNELTFMNNIECYLYNYYSYVVSNSFSGLKAFKQNGKKNRFVLYNGFNFKRVPNISKYEARKNISFDNNKFNVVMVSSLRNCFSKDPITFLKVANYIQEIDSNICFYIVGDGERKSEIEEFLIENNIINTKLLGNRSDVETIFLASDLSVLTSKTEGISNSIMESMACGVPCIATSGGGTPEIIEHEKNGFILPFGDYKAIAEKILFLKRNVEILSRLGFNAKKTIQERFAIDIMIKKFEEIIDFVSKNP